MIKNITTKQELDMLLQENERTILVDFWAPWCGPCQMLGRVIGNLAQSHDDQAIFVKVNIDDAPELAQEYGIRSIPTLIYFRNSHERDRSHGISSEKSITEKIEALGPARV